MLEFKSESFAQFGPAGNSDDFFEEGNKSVYDVPKWLEKNGLGAYE